jgi:DNA-binding FrmR family transcriptional regulator
LTINASALTVAFSTSTEPGRNNTPGGMVVSDVELPEETVDDLTRRLRRIEGQVRGLQAMLQDGRECRDVVTQLSAAARALEQVGFRLLATGLAQCLDDPEHAATEGESIDEFERLFLKLA